MTVSISKYKLSKQQHTIAPDYTLGENENPFTDLYAYDFQAFFWRIGMRFVKHEMVRLLSNQAHLNTWNQKLFFQIWLFYWKKIQTQLFWLVKIQNAENILVAVCLWQPWVQPDEKVGIGTSGFFVINNWLKVNFSNFNFTQVSLHSKSSKFAHTGRSYKALEKQEKTICLLTLTVRI